MRFLLPLIVLSSLGFGQGSTAAPSDGGPSQTTSESGTAVETSSLLPEPAPLPDEKASLIGGTVTSLDRVRDQLTVQIFGGNRMRVLFDGRTRVYRDGVAASYRDLQPGARVYLDTQLDGTKIFARNIRVVTQRASGESSGQILSIRSDKGELTMRDSISPEPIRLRLSADTKVLNGEHPAATSDLRPGTLVSVKLNPDGDGRGIAREITILAAPGTAFTFAGRVSYLDMHNGILVVVDPRDKKRYEVHFDPAVLRVGDNLREGADVTVVTEFDGTHYLANSVVVTSPANE